MDTPLPRDGSENSKRSHPPLSNDLAVEFTHDPDRNLIPWAGYVLGHESEMIPVWFDLVKNNELGLDDVESGVLATCFWIRLALDLLAHEIPRNNYIGIREILNDVCRPNEQFAPIEPNTPTSSDSLERDSSEVNWSERLAILVNGAIPSRSLAFPWYQFGQTFGQWRRRDYFRPGKSEKASFQSVIEMVKQMPTVIRDRIPVMARLSQLGHTANDWGVSLFLEVEKAVVGSAQGSKDALTASQFFHLTESSMHHQIDEGLRLLPRGEYVQQPVNERPQWTRKKQRITYKGKEVFVNVPRATNITPVLDEFEKENWKNPIDAPNLIEKLSKGEDAEALRAIKRDILNSLNDGPGRVGICFRGAGRLTGFTWEDESSEDQGGHTS